jgi:hypothetical protein
MPLWNISQIATGVPYSESPRTNRNLDQFLLKSDAIWPVSDQFEVFTYLGRGRGALNNYSKIGLSNHLRLTHMSVSSQSHSHLILALILFASQSHLLLTLISLSSHSHLTLISRASHSPLTFDMWLKEGGARFRPSTVALVVVPTTSTSTSTSSTGTN